MGVVGTIAAPGVGIATASAATIATIAAGISLHVASFQLEA
jgi:hypothetical protein